MPSAALLTIDNLSIRYGSDAAVVAGLSLDVSPGELVALLGPSGSGKSSLLRCIAGFVAPASGGIALDGRTITALPPERRAAALVFQQPALFPHLSVAENVAFGLRVRGVARAERLRQAEALLAQVQLAGLGPRRPHQLSGGQRGRVALARALITRPRLLLLDEPFASLDPALRGEMRALLLRLQQAQGLTTLLVTHDQHEAAEVADRVAVLLEGQLQQVAPPEELFARPASLAVARFLGIPNQIPAMLHGDHRAETALGVMTLENPQSLRGPATLVIRPEAVGLCRSGAGLQGVVRARQFLGGCYRYVVAVGEVELVAVTLQAEAQVGDTLAVSLPPEQLWPIPHAEPAR